MRLLGFIIFTLTVVLQVSASNSDALRKPQKRRASSEIENLDENFKRLRANESSITFQESETDVKGEQGSVSNGQKNLSQDPTLASDTQLGDNDLKKSSLKRKTFDENEEDSSDGLAPASKSFKRSSILPCETCLPTSSSKSSEFKRKLSEEFEPTNDDSKKQRSEILPSASAKQESPIKSSFEKKNGDLYVTLVLEPRQKDSTYTAEDVLEAFNEATPMYLIYNVTFRDMDLKTFASRVLDSIIDRIYKIRRIIIGQDPTLLYSFKDYFLKKFKEDYKTRRMLKMKEIEDYFQKFINKVEPSAEVLSKSDLYSYCCDKCIYHFGYTISREESGEYEIIRKFASFVQEITKDYGEIEYTKPNIVEYFNSRMDKKVKWFIDEYIEDNDSDFFSRYYYTLNSCDIFPDRFMHLFEDPCKEREFIQVMMKHFRNLKDKRFHIIYNDLKVIMSEFIDAIHYAKNRKGIPDDIYLKTFNDFNMKVPDEFCFAFKNCKWDPNSIKETSDKFGDNLMHLFKNKKGYAKTVRFCIPYPKNEKKESDIMCYGCALSQ